MAFSSLLGRGGLESRGQARFALICKNIRNLYEESKRFSDFKGKLQMKSPKQRGQSLRPLRIGTGGAGLLMEQGL